MVFVDYYTGSRCQMYYLALPNGNSGVVPVYGPFIWDFDTGTQAFSSSLVTVDFGKPIKKRNVGLDHFFHESATIHGENGVDHLNAHGHVQIIGNKIGINSFKFLPGSDTSSLMTGSYYFFPQSGSDFTRHWGSWDDYVGYRWGTSTKAKPDKANITPSYYYFPGGMAESFTSPDKAWDYSYATSGSVEGTSTFKSVYKKTGFTSNFEVTVSNFHGLNSCHFVFNTDGVIEEMDGQMDVIPVSVVNEITNDWDSRSIEELIKIPANYVSHCDIAAGSLAMDAVSSMAYIQSNTLENMDGWSNVKSNLPPIKSILHPRSPKDLASIYLWYKYSLSPNLQDIPEYGDKILNSYNNANSKGYMTKYATRWKTKLCRYGTITTRGNIRARIRPAAYTAVQSLYGDLRSLGLAPSIDNIWDLVPFSFVVDWFIPAGDNLAAAAYKFDVKMNMYDVYDVVQSRKSSLTMNYANEMSSLTGSVTYSLYERWVSTVLPTNSFEFGSNDPQNHIFEGSALVIANW